jgi:transmembrane sensor
MTERKTAKAINREAAEWLARVDRAPLDAEQQQALDAWLSADSRQRGAYVRGAAVWGELGRARALAVPPPSRNLDRKPARTWMLATGALAAALATAAALFVVGVLPGPAAKYQTTVGQLRHVALADGSTAAINTDSAVDVRMTPRLRAVRLERGEAWFKVAKNPARPFVVSAGDIRVRAVGTAFAVRRLPSGAQVQVSEGTVEIWSVKTPDRRTRAPAGGRLFVPGTGEGPRALAGGGVEDALAWRDGRLALEGMTLAQASAEFNRYNLRQIVVADPVLRQKRLVGWFRTDQPERFAEVVAQTYGAPVTTDARTIRLGAPPHD